MNDTNLLGVRLNCAIKGHDMLPLLQAAKEVMQVTKRCSIDDASERVKRFAVQTGLTVAFARMLLAENEWSYTSALEALRQMRDELPEEVFGSNRQNVTDEQKLVQFAAQTGLTLPYARSCLAANGCSVGKSIEDLWSVRHQLPAPAYRRFPGSIEIVHDGDYDYQKHKIFAVTIGFTACLAPANVEVLVSYVARATCMSGEYARNLLQQAGWDLRQVGVLYTLHKKECDSPPMWCFGYDVDYPVEPRKVSWAFLAKECKAFRNGVLLPILRTPESDPVAVDWRAVARECQSFLTADLTNLLLRGPDWYAVRRLCEDFNGAILRPLLNTPTPPRLQVPRSTVAEECEAFHVAVPEGQGLSVDELVSPE
jgi:hypothetical protein